MAGLPTRVKRELPEKPDVSKNPFSQLFEQKTTAPSHHKEAHWQALLKLGFPHAKHEDWRYTSLSRLLDHTFTLEKKSTVTPEKCRDLALFMVGQSHKLVFIDGHFIASLSEIDEIPYELLKRKQAVPAPVKPEFFLHLTESLSVENLVIRLAAGQKSKKPLYLLHISSGQETSPLKMAHYRHHLLLEPGSEAEVVEHFVSLNAQRHFTGARLTASIGEEARLHHYKLAFENNQSDHFAHNDFVLASRASVHSAHFLLGAALTRHHTSVQLNGEGASASINSLLLPKEMELFDSRTHVEHNQIGCQSRQLHKTMVSKQGTAVFNGMIKVAPKAIQTDAHMINNNLLLNASAQVNTKPQLEIDADDVKCSHGATVGCIDNQQMFYLQSRGITHSQARKMILFAFASELTEGIKLDLVRESVLSRFSERLSEELS
ncbi:Fe-S cluster assembly protein SufD [Candidatus Hamiltonella defensa]|uniref:FeS cluster assembly protein SufD n=1 Tax=Candidatus Williamhamiltonella defendens TaxID=138072 RepID=A0AAC9YEN3_9ENTR|nr:Fe-S cluster assembly protein SufD [Candidatus Hamiltonella defensa]ASV32831.1 FeS cluster assembly protein SufD [Candidatus Hamiltonella defensa]AWK15784.1 FeS cluster assembly protein SufD [Candidatus Hamiltonella defensa]MBK4361273.1 Fe-S cluster assembly protein SufD [Candidatus Hamiltonella defensa]